MPATSARPQFPTRPSRGTSQIGRIAGVRIEANWTLVIAFVLIAATLSGSVLPVDDPGLGHGTYLAMAIIATLAFFGCIVLHELGHALQARREGLETDRVTLWLFGGVAQLRGGFPSAAAEFRIAVAGPAVTVMLIGLLLAVGHMPGLPVAIDGVVSWLSYINIFLLLFNLLPALPLDGGRVLRSALWARRGDFGSATRAAADVSRVLAIFMIVLGVLGSFSSGVGGLWLALLGWFLLSAGTTERRGVSAP